MSGQVAFILSVIPPPLDFFGAAQPNTAKIQRRGCGMAEEVAVQVLPGPYEILELLNGETIFIKPIAKEYGKVIIRPRWPGAPPEKEVLALRVFVDPETKPFFPYYFDLTSRRLVALLGPIIDRIIGEGVWLRITKRGTAPKAWFEVQPIKELPPGVSPSLPVRL